MYCRNCGGEMDPNAAVCVKCGVAKGNGTKYCPNCGAEVAPMASFCTGCGATLQTKPVVPAGYEQRSKMAAGLLGIFLGGLGIHNFYLGYQTKALIQLLVSVIGGLLTCGIATAGMSIWGLIEGIMILTGSINVDGKGIPLKD